VRCWKLLVALACLAGVVGAGVVVLWPRQSQPLLVGVAFALGPVAMIELGSRFFRRHPLTRKQLSAFFLCGAVLFLAGAVWLAGAGHWWGSVLIFVEFSILFWAALGNWFEWPGLGSNLTRTRKREMTAPWRRNLRTPDSCADLRINVSTGGQSTWTTSCGTPSASHRWFPE